jgi:hypothetical protein
MPVTVPVPHPNSDDAGQTMPQTTVTGRIADADVPLFSNVGPGALTISGIGAQWHRDLTSESVTCRAGPSLSGTECQCARQMVVAAAEWTRTSAYSMCTLGVPVYAHSAARRPGAAT